MVKFYFALAVYIPYYFVTTRWVLVWFSIDEDPKPQELGTCLKFPSRRHS